MTDVMFNQLIHIRREEDRDSGQLLRTGSGVGPTSKLRSNTVGVDHALVARYSGVGGSRSMQRLRPPKHRKAAPVLDKKVLETKVPYPVWGHSTNVMCRAIPIYDAWSDVHCQRFFSSTIPPTTSTAGHFQRPSSAAAIAPSPKRPGSASIRAATFAGSPGPAAARLPPHTLRGRWTHLGSGTAAPLDMQLTSGHVNRTLVFAPEPGSINDPAFYGSQLGIQQAARRTPPKPPSSSRSRPSSSASQRPLRASPSVPGSRVATLHAVPPPMPT